MDRALVVSNHDQFQVIFIQLCNTIADCFFHTTAALRHNYVPGCLGSGLVEASAFCIFIKIVEVDNAHFLSHLPFAHLPECTLLAAKNCA